MPCAPARPCRSYTGGRSLEAFLKFIEEKLAADAGFARVDALVPLAQVRRMQRHVHLIGLGIADALPVVWRNPAGSGVLCNHACWHRLVWDHPSRCPALPCQVQKFQAAAAADRKAVLAEAEKVAAGVAGAQRLLGSGCLAAMQLRGAGCCLWDAAWRGAAC